VQAVGKWWEAPEWGKAKAMDFGKEPKAGNFRRVALTTEPHLIPTKSGQLRLELRNRHPHEALRIFCGDRQTARC
jgi:hypothetical protein